MTKLLRLALGGMLSIISGILWLLSLPMVRNFIWGKIFNKGRKKVIDVKARVVGEGKKDDGVLG